MITVIVYNKYHRRSHAIKFHYVDGPIEYTETYRNGRLYVSYNW